MKAGLGSDPASALAAFGGRYKYLLSTLRKAVNCLRNFVGVVRESLRAEGFDSDDPAVVGTIDLVRWERSLHLQPAPD